MLVVTNLPFHASETRINTHPHTRTPFHLCRVALTLFTGLKSPHAGRIVADGANRKRQTQMYSVIEIGMVLRSVAQFNSYAEAAEYVSRLSNPDGYVISEVTA